MPYIGNVTTSSNVNGSQINNGTITGDKLSLPFDYDSATLYLDNTNNRVGILTASPSSTLTVGTGGVVSIPLASAATPSLVFGTDTNTGIYSPGADQLAISTNGTQRLVIDASGNIGIGTTSAAFKLDCRGTIYSSVPSGTANFVLGDSTNGTQSSIRTSNENLIFTPTGGGSEALRITAAGLVGIGTSSPGYLLDVGGNARIGNAPAATNVILNINGVASKASRIAFQESGVDKWLIGNGAASENGNFEIYDTVNGNNFVITHAGRVGIGTSSPQGKLHVVGDSATPGAGNINISNATYPTSGWAFRIPDNGATIDLSLDGAIAGTWRSVMYFNRSTGNVGIGTTAPQFSFVVSNGGANGFEVSSATNSGTTSYLLSYNRSTSAYTDMRFDASAFRFEVSSAERMRLTSTGLGIGTTAPVGKLSVETASATDPGTVVTAGWDSTYVLIGDSDNTNGANLGLGFRTGGITSGFGTQIVSLDPNADWYPINYHGNLHVWYGGGTERARIDTSGRLLVGTSSYSGVHKLVVRARTDDANSNGGLIIQRGATPTAADQFIGIITFEDPSSNPGAYISTQSDGGAWTSGSSHPTRLTFSVTSDGSASPSEALRISNDRSIGITQAPGKYSISTSEGATSIANNGIVDFAYFSGFVLVTNYSNGAVQCWLAGAGGTTSINTVGGTAGSLAYNAGVNTYRWTNNSGSAATFGFFCIRTRSAA